MDPTLIEIRDYNGEGYRPLIDYASWRVAIMRHCDSHLPEKIERVERHVETDEVFVLLAGQIIVPIIRPIISLLAGIPVY